jgi:hypothetical protein
LITLYSHDASGDAQVRSSHSRCFGFAGSWHGRGPSPCRRSNLGTNEPELSSPKSRAEFVAKSTVPEGFAMDTFSSTSGSFVTFPLFSLCENTLSPRSAAVSAVISGNESLTADDCGFRCWELRCEVPVLARRGLLRFERFEPSESRRPHCRRALLRRALYI